MSGGDTRITRGAKTGPERGQADAGVRRCMQLMTDGSWETGRSPDLVAAEFGVSPRTVESWAATASRTLRLAIGDGEELRGRLAVMLERHERVAMSRKGYTMAGEAYDNPDVKAATGAIKTLADVLGLITDKHLILGAQVTEEKFTEFRNAVVALLCADCREKVLAHVREQKEPAK